MKSVKKFALLLLTLAVAVSVLFALGSCGPDEEPSGPVTYTVTVLDSDGTGIENAVVRFKVGNAPYDKRTNIAGVASVVVAPESLNQKITAEIMELPTGYTVAESLLEFGDKTSLTFTAISTYQYTVNVLAGGEGVYGARVKLFVGDDEVDDGITNIMGVAVFQIPATGEAVSARITAPIGYVASETALTFDSSREVTFELRQQSEYTVSTRDLYGFAVKGVEISVYRRSDGALMLTRTIPDSGRTSFYLDKDNYYVTVSVINPAIILTHDADADGVKRVPLLEDESEKTLFFSETQENITYTVNAKDSSGNPYQNALFYLFDGNHALRGTALTGADGVAEFSCPNGNYIAVMYGDENSSASPFRFFKNGAVVADITVSDSYIGADPTDPAQLLDNSYNKVTLPAGASAWFYLVSASNRSVTVEQADGLKIVYDGADYLPVGGVITVPLSGVGEAIIEIVNTTDATLEATMNVNKAGSASNPITLTLGSAFEVILVDGESVYYVFTAVGNKTLKIELDGTYSDLATVTLNGKEATSIALKDGQRAVLVFSALSFEDGTVDYSFTAEFEENYVDYSVNVQIEGLDNPAGIDLELVKDGVPTGIFATVGADGEAVFENILEYPGYSVRVPEDEMPEGYEVIAEESVFDELKAGISITLIPTGTIESPYDIVIGNAYSFTSLMDGVVWLEINIRGVSESIVEFIASNAIITVYSDKEGTVAHTIYADGSGASYIFNEAGNEDALGEGVYYVKVQMPGTSLEVNTAAAGYSEELPQKLSEGGEFVATVKEDGGSVYYEYTGALSQGDTVTVTVESGATLTVGGEPVTGESYTFTYSGSDILFAVSAAVADNYDVEITVATVE